MARGVLALLVHVALLLLCVRVSDAVADDIEWRDMRFNGE
jgi:hypothetical protein